MDLTIEEQNIKERINANNKQIKSLRKANAEMRKLCKHRYTAGNETEETCFVCGQAFNLEPASPKDDNPEVTCSNFAE